MDLQNLQRAKKRSEAHVTQKELADEAAAFAAAAALQAEVNLTRVATPTIMPRLPRSKEYDAARKQEERSVSAQAQAAQKQKLQTTVLPTNKGIAKEDNAARKREERSVAAQARAAQKQNLQAEVLPTNKQRGSVAAPRRAPTLNYWHTVRCLELALALAPKRR